MVYLTLSIEISVYKYDIKPGLIKCRAVEWVPSKLKHTRVLETLSVSQ